MIYRKNGVELRIVGELISEESIILLFGKFKKIKKIKKRLDFLRNI